METKFTKGPWHFDGGADWSVHAASGAVIAEVYDSRADATLIAAAPDLYEAMEEAVGAIDQCIAVFERDPVTLGGIAAVHFLKEAQSKYRAVLTRIQGTQR